jgi:hypothetical protein
MVELVIRNEDLARRLFEIAARDNSPVETLLEAMIAIYEARPLENPLLKMAAAADALGATADRDDVSEHFDALLRESWGKHGDDQQADMYSAEC